MKKLIGIWALLFSTQALAAGGPALLYDGYGNPIASTSGALNIAGTFSSTTASNGVTGAAVPAQANYTGVNKAGNLVGLLMGQQTMANSLAVALSSDQSAIPVSGTFWQATQPISAAALPLPTGAATETTLAKLPVAQGAALGANSQVMSGASVTTAAPSYTTGQISPLSLNTAGGLRVDGSGVTQPVSAAALPLPTGAATAAKQPALGTAGTPSVDVLTVQGAASMTALKTDGSAVTQPVSAASLPLPTGAATETTLAKLPIAQGAALGANSQVMSGGSVTTAAPSYTTGQVSPLSLTTAGGLRVDGSSVTQPVSAAALPLPTGAATSALQTTISGQLPATLGQKTMAASMAMTLASDQSAVPTKAAVNVNGSGAAAAATVSTVITLTAPANAVGAFLMNLDTSTANLRWAVGRTATTTLGQQLQPGRDVWIPTGANISLVAESGTQNYDVQWISQ